MLPINITALVSADVYKNVEDDEPAHTENVAEEDTSSESEDDMSSFLRRDPSAVVPPPEAPPTPEPIATREALSLDEEIDEPDDTDNSLIIVDNPVPPVLVVSDDVHYVHCSSNQAIVGDVKVVPRQQLFPVPDLGLAECKFDFAYRLLTMSFFTHI